MTKTAAKKKVEKDHAKTGKPISPTEDPEKHAVSAGTIAAQTDPSGKSGVAVNAKSIDAVNEADKAKEDAEKMEADQSILAKMRRAGLFFVRDHSRGGDGYIGPSPQNDPKADQASRERSLVEPVEMHPPRTGMQVRLADGVTFSVPDGFGPSDNADAWGRVTRPDGSPLFT